MVFDVFMGMEWFKKCVYGHGMVFDVFMGMEWCLFDVFMGMEWRLMCLWAWNGLKMFLWAWNGICSMCLWAWNIVFVWYVFMFGVFMSLLQTR